MLLLKLMGDIGKETHDLDTAASYYPRCIDMARHLQHIPTLIEVLNDYSAVCWKQGDLNHSEELAREALSHAETLADSKTSAGVLTMWN